MGLLIVGELLREMGLAPATLDLLAPGRVGAENLKRSDHGHGHFHRERIEKPECLNGIPMTFARYGLPMEEAEAALGGIPRPDIILVTGVMTYWYTGVRETIDTLRRFFPRATVILGGIYATLLPEHARIHSGADIVAPGLGEASIAALIRETTGFQGHHTSVAPYAFKPMIPQRPNLRFLPLLTSRGCPFKCAYCASGALAKGYVRRDIGDIVSEIIEGVENHNIRDIALYDDAFLVGAKTHALDLLDRISQRYDHIRWHCPNGLHCSEMDSQTAWAMKRAGFETVRLGFESSSDTFHRESGAKTTVNQFMDAVSNLRLAGFTRKQVGAYILVGLPGQTATEIEDSVEVAINAGATPKLAEFSPIPRAPLWGEAVRKSRRPIEKEPLFHNCSLLVAAEKGVDRGFLARTRKRISERLGAAP